MFTRKDAKRQLKQQGWSLRRAAEFLGRSTPHLSLVLDGHRESRNLLARIQSMPPSPVPYTPLGFALKSFKRTSKKQNP